MDTPWFWIGLMLLAVVVPWVVPHSWMDEASKALFGTFPWEREK